MFEVIYKCNEGEGGHHLIKLGFINQDITPYHPLAVIFENKLFNHVDIDKDAGPPSFLNTFPTILPLCNCMKQSTHEKKSDTLILTQSSLKLPITSEYQLQLKNK